MRIRSWASPSRLAKSLRARNQPKRTKPYRLRAESLEQRVVLDGSGGASFVLFSPFVDSQLGDDPHTEIMGEDATPITFDGNLHGSIGSYIDQPNDVDVFLVTAVGDTLNVTGDATLEVALHLYDVDGNVVEPIHAVAADTADVPTDIASVEPAPEDGDAFVGCDWGPFGLCDIFPTEPGATYFVTVGGSEVTEYYFDFFSPIVPEPADRLDSDLGEDMHPNQIGPDSTQLEFEDNSQLSAIHSNLDEPGDIDVFQFDATGGWISAFISLGQELDLRMEIMDADGAVIATNREFLLDFIGLSVAEPIVETDLNVGEQYYLQVSSPNDEVGEYRIEIFQDIDLDPPAPTNQADSELGADPHSDTIGPDATRLDFGDAPAFDADQWVSVDSFIDHSGDIDVFQFEATGDWVNAFAFSMDGSFEMRVTIHDSRGESVGINIDPDFGPEGEPTIWMGPADAEIIPGEIYYLVVGGINGGFGEYLLEVNQHRMVPPQTVGDPDSPQGSDPHADTIGDSATPLLFDGEFTSDFFGESYAHIDSYIDIAGDVDTFQFVASGEWLSAFAFAWDGSFEPRLTIYDGEGSVLSESQNLDPNVEGELSPIGDVPLAPGMTYYISIDAADDGAGEYVLDLYQHLGEDFHPSTPPREPDSDFGADPHVDVIGPDATPLEFDFELDAVGQPRFGQVHVDSYVDFEDDVDVFQFVAEGHWIDLNVHPMRGDLTPTVRIFDSEGASVSHALDFDSLDGDGTANSPWAAAETSPGMYYVVIESAAGGTGAYALQAFHESWTEPLPPWSNADSEPGEDPHADIVGPQASQLEFHHADPWYGFGDVNTYIDSESDIDVFSFIAEKDVLHATAFALNGRMATRLSLYDTAGNLVTRSPLAGPELGLADSSYISHDLLIGSIYYLAVSSVDGATGEYVLEVSQEKIRPLPTQGSPDSDFGDDAHVNQIGRGATRLEFAGDGNGEGHAKVDTYLDTPEDIDVFGFQSKGNSVSIYGSAWDGSFGIQIELLSSDGEVVASMDSGDWQPVDVDPTTGQPDPTLPATDDLWLDGELVQPFFVAEVEVDSFYFISVGSQQGATGEYVLDIHQRKTKTTNPNHEPGLPNIDSRLGDDVHTDEIGNASTSLEFAIPNPGSDTLSSVSSFIDFAGDADAFQWIAESGNATVSAYVWSPQTGFSVDVYDADQNLIAQSRASGREEFASYANLAFPTSIGDSYYVVVTGIGISSGEYTLNVTQYDPVPFEPSAQTDSEFGDDVHSNIPGSEATPIELDPWGEGFVSSHIDSEGDIDIFQIHGTGGHMFTLGMSLDPTSSVDIRVLDFEFNELALAESPLGLLPGLSVWESIEGATYFVKVAGANRFTGPYYLSFMGMNRATATDDAWAVTPESELNDSINLFLAQLPDAPNVGERNGTSGDANFDGQIDTRDYQIWNQNKFTMAAGPANGDFNNDGAVDGSDFNLWKSNSFSAANAASSSRPPQAPLDARSSGEAVWDSQNDGVRAQRFLPADVTFNTSPDRIDSVIGFDEAIEAESDPTFEQSGQSLRERSRRNDAGIQRRSRLLPPRSEAAPNESQRPSLIDQFFSELDDIF